MGVCSIDVFVDLHFIFSFNFDLLQSFEHHFIFVSDLLYPLSFVLARTVANASRNRLLFLGYSTKIADDLPIQKAQLFAWLLWLFNLLGRKSESWFTHFLQSCFFMLVRLR